MKPEIYQLGALGIIFLFAIKEFFGYLKSRKKNGNGGKLLEEVKLLNSNHLNSIEKAINDGNSNIVTAITNMHTEVAGELGEIKGKLDK